MSNPSFNRPPLNRAGCYPQPSQVPQAIDDPCKFLNSLRAAYYALLSGKQSAQIRDGERWQSFHRGDAKMLRAEITKLSIMCDPNMKSRAVRAGPYATQNAAPGFGFPFGYGWPF
jgi:hypothetical protein